MRFIYTKTFAIFSFCLAVLAIMMFLQVKGWLDPVKRLFLQLPRPVTYAAKSVTLPVKNFFTIAYRLKKISEENTQLQAKVIKMQQDLIRLDQEISENKALRKELGFAESLKGQLIPCNVLSKNPFGLTDALVLNCGEGKGVTVGQAIVSQGYLVGKVVYVGKDYSTALLATNSGFSTDAKLSKTGTGGVARGSFGSGLVLDQLPQNAPVESGWLVVTAGIDSKIPKNILVGEVGEIISNSNELFNKTTLLSPVNLDVLDFVFVVK